jgi:fermentation-respiration switch protein FrsA (DUF1100 family)
MYPRLPMGLLIHLVRSRFDSMSKIGNVHVPLLVLHGDQDATIPIEVGWSLFDAANEPKRFHVIKGGGHSDGHMIGGADYYKAFQAFVKDPAQ